jgi:thiamine-monophosphate kinase
MQTVSDLTESELIERIRRRLPPAPDWLVVGIGDDAAVVAPARNRHDVLTVDAIVDGVHFDRRFSPPAAIGHRALAVNLSDLAAMGAEPRLALLSLALPADHTVPDFDCLVSGLTTLAKQHSVHVVGGNLTRSPGPLMIDVTVTGTVKPRQALTRDGARPGDEIYVSGSVGAAAAGLEMLRTPGRRRADHIPLRSQDSLVSSGGARRSAEGAEAAGPPLDPCTARYLYPEPRVRLGLTLGRNRAATSCVDLSDGLGDGVRRIAEASGVGVVIDAGAVPIEPEAERWFAEQGKDPVLAAIAGGDDYELLFTVRPRLRGRLSASRRHGKAPITKIGVCTAEGALVLRRASGAEEPIPGGYTHFR